MTLVYLEIHCAVSLPDPKENFREKRKIQETFGTGARSLPHSEPRLPFGREAGSRRRLHPGPGRWSGLELYDLLGCYFRERREAAEGYLFSREIILRGANSVES